MLSSGNAPVCTYSTEGMRMMKKMLSMLLVTAVLVGLCPLDAFATEGVSYDIKSGLFFKVITDDVGSGVGSFVVTVVPYDWESYNNVEGIVGLSYGKTSYTIPSSVSIPIVGVPYVTRIGYAAFDGNKTITSITFATDSTATDEYHLRIIEYSAFKSCSALTTIGMEDSNKNELPEGITTIEYDAFENCTSLYDLTLPSTVSRVADTAFQGCDNLDLVVTLKDHDLVIPLEIFDENGGFQGTTVKSVTYRLESPNYVSLSDTGMASWTDLGTKYAAYKVELMRDSQVIKEVTAEKGVQQCDFYSIIKNEGPGNYRCRVTAVKDVDTAAGMTVYSSDAVYSNTIKVGLPTFTNARIVRTTEARATLFFESDMACDAPVYILNDNPTENDYKSFANGTTATKAIVVGENSLSFDIPAGDPGYIHLWAMNSFGQDAFLSLAIPDAVEPEKVFRVTYHANGGTGDVPVDKGLYTEDSRVTLLFEPKPTRNGYTFLGWSRDANATEAEFKEPPSGVLPAYFYIRQNITLYAVWEMNSLSCTITYDSNGYDVNTTPSNASGQQYPQGTAVQIAQGWHPDSLMTFISWNTKKDGTGDTLKWKDEYALSQDTTLYAQWKCAVNDAGIWADMGCENSIPNAAPIVEIGGEYTFTVTLMEGWEKDADFAVTNRDVVLTPVSTSADGRTMTYTLTNIQQNASIRVRGTKQAEAPETYTVTYDANGGEGNVPQDENEYLSGAQADVLFDAVPTKEGYVFLGWAKDETATQAAYTKDGVNTLNITGNVTLYAVWEKEAEPETYTVTLPKNQVGYWIVVKPGSTSPVAAGGSYTFIFHLEPGYKRGSHFAVKSNGVALSFSSDEYTISNITENQQVTVEGVETFSGDAGVREVKVDGVVGTVKDTVIEVELPYGTTLPTDGNQVNIIPAADARVSDLKTEDGGVTWHFTVTADDGTTKQDYTIRVTVGDPLPLVITTQPKDQQILSGEQGTFAVSAQGEGLRYQWQIDRNDGKDWQNLPGATAASYTTSPAEEDCNGFQYRCVVRDALGNSETSAVAVLQVEKAPVLPETGDNQQPILYLVLMLAGALGIITLKKRRKA